MSTADTNTPGDPVHRHTGRCRCGGVRMGTDAVPDFSVYCHCDDCRRATGGPILASIGLPKDAVHWIADETLRGHRQGTATRLFCSHCGSGVAQSHDSQPDMVFINTGFMDRPQDFPPRAHTFYGDRLPWLALNDDLTKVETTILIDTQ